LNKNIEASYDGTFNNRDIEELNNLYGTAQTSGVSIPSASVSLQSYRPSTNTFTYSFLYEPANVYPYSEPEHVALINFGIDPSLVLSIVAPPGWRYIIPGPIVSQEDPFFTDDYMEDVFPEPAPWGSVNPMSYISLRIKSSDVDPSLSPRNQSLIVQVISKPNVSLGPIDVYAGDDLQTVMGPVPGPIPALGAAGILAWSRKLRNRIRTFK